MYRIKINYLNHFFIKCLHAFLYWYFFNTRCCVKSKKYNLICDFYYNIIISIWVKSKLQNSLTSQALQPNTCWDSYNFTVGVLIIILIFLESSWTLSVVHKIIFKNLSIWEQTVDRYSPLKTSLVLQISHKRKPSFSKSKDALFKLLRACWISPKHLECLNVCSMDISKYLIRWEAVQ